MITPERWKIVERIFHEALDEPPAERSAFVVRSCGADSDLLHEIESLLASENKEPLTFSPVEALAADWGQTAFREDLLSAEIDRFRILAHLGSGGMGDVFLAEEPALGRKVALKFLSSPDANDAGCLQRFLNEAQALSLLNHPGILTVHQTGEYGGRPYIVAEYVEGETIRRRLARGPLPPMTALDIAIKAGEALAAAHAAGIVHRDIKPENIMIRSDGYVKVLDFGLAKLIRREISPKGAGKLTQMGAVVGTVDYMAPEQAAGKNIDSRTDVYSLAVVLYEMLTGTLPREIGGSSRSSPVPRVLPKRVLAVLRRGLASDPEARYPDMPGFVADVATLRNSFRPAFRKPAIAATTAAILLIASIFAWRIERVKPTGSSLLVMPFHSLSPDPDQTHLETGLADAVITRLAGFPQLRVPPFAAVKPAEDPFEAARRLGADTVLTGTVEREGAELRVTAQLARTADRSQIWASRFDEPFTDILTVEDTIAGRIASNLLADTSLKARATLKHRDTENVQAYDLYLRAREQWARRTPESIRVAIRMYQDAIALDPRFSLAYAGLADCYNLTVSGLEPSVRFPLARTAVAQAIALDPQSAPAHTANAFMLYKFEWKWKEAEREFRLAIQLDPSYVLAHHWFGEFLKLLMRHDESIAEFRKAIDLDPFSIPVRYDYILALLNAGRVTEAAKEVSDGLAIDPMAGRLFMVRADILELQGRAAESADTRFHAYRLGGVSEAAVAAQREAFRAGGIAAMKRKILEQNYPRTLSDKTPGAASGLALGNAEIHDRTATLHWLEIAADRTEDAPLLMKTHLFDFVRDNPQFQQLLHRIGLDIN